MIIGLLSDDGNVSNYFLFYSFLSFCSYDINTSTSIFSIPPLWFLIWHFDIDLSSACAITISYKVIIIFLIFLHLFSNETFQFTYTLSSLLHFPSHNHFIIHLLNFELFLHKNLMNILIKLFFLFLCFDYNFFHSFFFLLFGNESFSLVFFCFFNIIDFTLTMNSKLGYQYLNISKKGSEKSLHLKNN